MDTTPRTRDVTFLRQRETKRFVRFEEQPPDGQAPIVGILYLRKEVANGARTVHVALTLEN